MKSKVKQGSTTHFGELYTRCLACDQRAYIVKEWRPAAGLANSLRQFKCEHGHETYKSLSADVLFLLASSPVC